MVRSPGHHEHAFTYLVWLDGHVDRHRLERALQQPGRHLPIRRPWMLLLDLRAVTSVDPEASEALRRWLGEQGPTLLSVAAVVGQEEQRDVLPAGLSRPPTRAFSRVAAAQAWFAWMTKLHR